MGLKNRDARVGWSGAVMPASMRAFGLVGLDSPLEGVSIRMNSRRYSVKAGDTILHLVEYMGGS